MIFWFTFIPFKVYIWRSMQTAMIELKYCKSWH